MPEARGEAKVESKQGVIKIDADMEKLGPATQFGQEYLTYVMWAITPEGRATNVGEVLLNNSGKTKLDATTELQSFGLIVTAEPYFAVTQPSDVVVMENFVRKDTTGTIEEVDAKYELLQRGQYVLNVKPGEIQPRAAQPESAFRALRGAQRGADRALDWRRAVRRRHIPKGCRGSRERRGLSDRQGRQEADRHRGARSRSNGGGRPDHHRQEDRRRAIGHRAHEWAAERQARAEGDTRRRAV